MTHISYLAIGPVNLINYISQQNLLIHSIVEFLILGVLADLQVVSFEGLAHTETKMVSKKKTFMRYLIS